MCSGCPRVNSYGLPWMICAGPGRESTLPYPAGQVRQTLATLAMSFSHSGSELVNSRVLPHGGAEWPVPAQPTRGPRPPGPLTRQIEDWRRTTGAYRNSASTRPINSPPRTPTSTATSPRIRSKPWTRVAVKTGSVPEATRTPRTHSFAHPELCCPHSQRTAGRPPGGPAVP